MSPPRSSDHLVTLDERGQAFLRRARGLRGLTPHQVARIGRRLKERRPARRGRVMARASAAIVLVLMVGAAAAWASGVLAHWPGLKALLGRRGPAAAGQPTTTVVAPAPRPGAALEPVLPPAAFETAPGAADAHRRPAAPQTDGPLRPAHRDQRESVRQPGRHRSGAASRLAATTPGERSGPEAAIVLEGRSLAAALELWRARRDTLAALAALDQHDRRFADGQMRVEARALRAEIFLANRREGDALAVLDRLPLDQVPRGRELRTLRGELRVRLGRCDEGRPDLESISRGTDAFATRAREALAQCP